MKRNKKTLLTLALATMFVGAGAGAIAAIDTVNEPAAITASAEATAVDMASQVNVLNWVQTNDYADTPLYRIALTQGDTATWTFAANNNNAYYIVKNSDSALQQLIYVNGKSVADHVAEYKEAVAAGEREAVTSLQPDITRDAENYAPILVKAVYHSSLNAKCLDIYIPSDYLAKDEVASITIKAGFVTELISAGQESTEQGHYLSKDVTCKMVANTSTSSSKQGAVVSDLEEIPVDVTSLKWYGTGEERNWFGLTLDGHDYLSGDNYTADKTYADKLNLYENIYVDGVSLASYCVNDNSSTTECYFTGSNHHGADVLSFRTPSQFNLDKIMSVQEIVIKAGCQLPCYTDTTKCFVVEEDITFYMAQGRSYDNEIVAITADNTSVSSTIENGVVKIALTLPEGVTCPVAEWDYNYGGYATLRSYLSLVVGGSNSFTLDVLNEMAASESALNDYSSLPHPYNANANFQKSVIVHNVKDSNVLTIWIDARLFGDDYLPFETVSVKIGAGFTMSNGDYSVVTGAAYEDVVLENVSVSTCTVTVDGVEKTVMNKATIAQPEADATYEEDGYLYTLEGWKTESGALWNFDTDLTYEGLVLTKSYTQEAITYTVTFIADGETVGTDTYTVEDKEITVPEVPAKEHYTAAWETYELTTGNKTVNAVYTAVEYTVTFVADGETVDADTYTVDNTGITVPEIPAKDGYTAAWETYELNGGDKTVNAVYTEIPVEPAEEESGCGSVIGGVSAAVAMLGAAVVVLKKKKED